MRKIKILNLLMLIAGTSFIGSVYAYPTQQNGVTMVTPGVAVTSGLGSIGVGIQQQQQQPLPPKAESATNAQAAQQANQGAPGISGGAAATTPGTAYSQGYGKEEVDVDKEISDFKEFNSARQKGVVVTVPMPTASWAKNKANKIWLTNWKGVLVEQAGVSVDKINFEASRLSKAEFEDWATRQIRVVNPDANYVNY